MTGIILGSMGCSATGDGDEAVEQVTAPIAADIMYDRGTQCTFEGVSIHCCPSGYAMIGAEVDENVFACARIEGLGTPFLDTGTQRYGMHACPYGTFMVGLHAGRNWLICNGDVSRYGFEYIDGNPPTYDFSFVGMHICDFYDYGYLMSGIHSSDNNYLCISPGRS